MITASILALVLAILLIGRMGSHLRFSREVKALFKASDRNADKVFSYDQLESLPEPVQRYFKLVLKEGQPYISYISLTHDGQFKAGLDKGWMNIKGEQYFTTQRPGFIWKGSTNLFTARDMFMEDRGSLKVSILNLYPLAEGKGSSFDEGELQRWVAESVWFPTNLLPGEFICWTPVNAFTAQLSFRYKTIAFEFKVRFNAAGEITAMETKRFMGETGSEAWIVRLAGYKRFDGMFIPTKCEALWLLPKGEFPYARFVVQKVVYNVPGRM